MTDKERKRVNRLIFAAECIDAQEPPPATEDIEELHAAIQSLRNCRKA